MTTRGTGCSTGAPSLPCSVSKVLFTCFGSNGATQRGFCLIGQPSTDCCFSSSFLQVLPTLMSSFLEGHLSSFSDPLFSSWVCHSPAFLPDHRRLPLSLPQSFIDGSRGAGALSAGRGQQYQVIHSLASLEEGVQRHVDCVRH